MVHFASGQMENMMRRILAVVVVILAGFLGGCETVSPRTPTVSNVTAPDYHKVPVTDIAVLSVEVAIGDQSDAWFVPAVALRRKLLQQIVGRKNYATPRAEWVDEQIAKTPGGLADLNTDAILSVVIDQWDESRIKKTGSIYMGGTFKLVGAGNRTLWEYTCHDVRYSSESSMTPRSEEIRPRAAARFIEQVMGTLPAKRTRTVGS